MNKSPMKRNILLLIFCLAFSLLAGSQAQWIAFNESTSVGNGEKRYFRYEFDIPDKEIESAVVCFLFGGSGQFFYVNGSSAEGKGTAAHMYEVYSSTQPKKQFEIKSILKKGATNCVATDVTNSSAADRGFIAHLLIKFTDNSIMEVFSDTNWTASKAPGSTDYHDFAKAGFTGGTWSKAISKGDCGHSQWSKYDMLPLFSKEEADAEIARRGNVTNYEETLLNKLDAATKDTAEITYDKGGAFFRIGGKLYRPVLYNCNDGWKNVEKQPFCEQVKNFIDSDIRLITFSFEASDFWTGVNKYNYDAVDNAMKAFYKLVCIDENGFNEDVFNGTHFLVSLNFSHGPTWWNRQYPNETVKYARVDVDSSRGDTVGTFPNNVSGDGIGNFEIHSYASEQWIHDSTEAIRKFVEHIEASRYGKRVFAYRFGDGVYSEWSYFGMEGAMPDVGAPMLKLFRNYLREKYGNNVSKLRAAWNQSKVTFDNALIPPVEVRLKYLGNSLRNPKDAWGIDYLECIAYSQKNLLLSMDKAAKEACNGRCLVGNYCGYFFGMGYSTEGCYPMNDEILDSEYIDFEMSPCCYSSEFRKVGGSQMARCLEATYRLRNKLCIFEADSRTYLANKGSKFVDNLQDSLATLSRDLAQAIGYGCAYWYYDFGEVWYNDPAIYQFFHQIAPVYDSITDFNSSSDIAIIGDFESIYYHAIQDYGGGLPTYIATGVQTLELNKAGLTFNSYSFADIDNPELQNYKMYIFPQLFYMTPEKQEKLNALKKQGKTLLFMNAAGWLTPDGPSKASVIQTTGIDLTVEEQVSDVNTKITAGANKGVSMKNSGKIYPVLNVTDQNATVLGTVTYSGSSRTANAYARKENVNNEGWTSYVCSAPFITSAEFREIAKRAGVHSYCDSSAGVVYANNSMIAFHTGTTGTYTLKAKSPVKWKMVYPTVEENFSSSQSEHTFTVPKAETYIFIIKP